MMKKTIIRLILIISVIILAIVGYIFVKDYLQRNENNNDIEDLIDEVFVENEETSDSSIDWDSLKSTNEDIIGWLEIENTSINYPILKDTNNLYYLKHNYLKKYNSNGSIFTLDSNPFNDYETLIYGHNMRNGTMFSLLGNYLNKDFLFSHQKIKIYTPVRNFEGRIKYYKKASQVKIDNVNVGEKIVKLTTCSYINSKTRPTNQRYYIIATLNEIN